MTERFSAGHSARDIEVLAETSTATRLRIYRLGASIAPLGRLPALEHVELNDPITLEGLGQLRQISSLTLYHFPHVRSLEPIGQLTQLRTLHLSTPPSYDASRKCFDVDSLAPLGRLKQLESLVMRGVLPTRDRLEPLYVLSQLARLEITRVYAFGLEDYARLAAQLPHTTGHCLVPYFSARWTGTCKKCGSPRAALTGPPPRTPRLLCPACNLARLERHVAAWKAVEGHADSITRRISRTPA